MVKNKRKDKGVHFKTIREELILVKNLGIQLTTKYTTGLKTVFIPFEQIRRIFINEVIYRSRVIYVLSLLTKDTDVTEKLVPLFFNTLPRIDCLKVIYKKFKSP
ncbi:hypothetical protein NQ317_010702 [Molorchus minor]|uniref:Phosphatidylinositol N-acetylglucosaminyltransferase subunit H conserved domain-containing protein n=1 Tax=Molorchus minor TaxID=1323400 RepID=A0ABQ9K5S3_9CUCU|nr:hypothetical protein NQ317_010702 [Molorchus minor]